MKMKWKFSIWRLSQTFLVGVEWCTDKSKLVDFDIYLGFFALGWIKLPVEQKD